MIFQKIAMKMLNGIIMTAMVISFILMIFSKHPMTLGMMVISQCIMMATILTKNLNFSWFSFFIFIIYLGGILMLFSYVISLTFSKEPMTSGLNKEMMLILSFILLVMFTLSNKETTVEFSKIKFQNMIFSCFSSSMKISMFLLIFLLIIMVMVVFMTESSKGNMRTM
uniref:NADH dehydrogenase subunit 6 n=1 Tax=Lefroyothrips lefroyi TaxID=1030666 RepID=UPI00292A4057|nr:NADH dehydrogenase subunit 6 [Lefroyothrips lefroyi]WNL54552.1 NADH dehydrogenase subunit 6 [Lefroyothrips lefroyi]